jgi:hypothetical protein
MSIPIRVSEATRERFAKLSEATGRSVTQLFDDAADALERRLFFDQFSSRYQDLRADPAAWTSIESERELECGAVRHPPA